MNKKILKIIMIVGLSLIIAGCSVAEKDVVEDNEVSLVSIYEEIREHLGDAYVSDLSIDEDVLSDEVGVSLDNVSSYIADMSMMSTHVDRYISIMAMDGQAEEVEKNLIDYKDFLIEDSVNYPMNIAKVNSAEVVRHGDYVFFIMLGKFDEREDATESEQIEFAKEEVNKIKEIIDKNFEEVK